MLLVGFIKIYDNINVGLFIKKKPETLRIYFGHENL